MFVSLLQAAATADPATFLGSTPAGWVTNGIVVALVLFIRHLYETWLASSKEERGRLDQRVEKLDDRDQLRSDTFERALRALEQQVALGKDQNEIIRDIAEKNNALVANMQGWLDGSQRRTGGPR